MRVLLFLTLSLSLFASEEIFNKKCASCHVKMISKAQTLKNIKKLKNHYPPLRYRVGEYRVLFDVVDDILIVVNVKHRREAYE